MSEFHRRRQALYAEFPAEATAYESEFKELQERLAEVERERDALRELLRDIRPDSYNPDHIRRIDAALERQP